jgi:ABC-type polysaccharide/polyol phosphate transport system ATPase subunit
MSTIVIEGEGLGKSYHRGALQRSTLLRDHLSRILKSPLAVFRRHKDELFWALQNVSLEVRDGEVLGLIGRNGSGKTTLLKILSRITKPTTGWAEITGRVGSLLEVGTGFHPELTGHENVYLSGAILGMGKREISRKFDEIVSFAELEKFIETPVKHYSSGMYVRLAFAVAAHLEPEILLVDEVLAVGDMNFQKKCLGKMGEVAQAGTHGRSGEPSTQPDTAALPSRHLGGWGLRSTKRRDPQSGFRVRNSDGSRGSRRGAAQSCNKFKGTIPEVGDRGASRRRSAHSGEACVHKYPLHACDPRVIAERHTRHRTLQSGPPIDMEYGQLQPFHKRGLKRFYVRVRFIAVAPRTVFLAGELIR